MTALSDCEHHRRGPDTIAGIRLWALSECGLYRRNTIVGAIGMWSLSDEVNQGRFCRTSYASWQLWTADLGGVPQIPILNRRTCGASKTRGWSPQNPWRESRSDPEGDPCQLSVLRFKNTAQVSSPKLPTCVGSPAKTALVDLIR